MLLHELRVLGPQPQTRDRETRETRNFANTSLAQQIQGVATGSDEDKLGVDCLIVSGVQVLGGHAPLGAIALNVNDLVAVANLGTRGLSCSKELLSQGTEVHVGTSVGPRDSNLLGVEVTALRHERQVFLEGSVIIAELHVREHVVVLERIEATLEVIHLDRALSEGHVRDLVNEGARVGENAVVELVRPELARNLEFLINVHGLRNVNTAVLLWGVVQLAQCRVAGTGVIPRGGRLKRGTIEALEDHLGPARLELAEHGAESGAHNTRTNEGNLNLVYYLCCLLIGGHCTYYLFESMYSMWSSALRSRATQSAVRKRSTMLGTKPARRSPAEGDPSSIIFTLRPLR